MYQYKENPKTITTIFQLKSLVKKSIGNSKYCVVKITIAMQQMNMKDFPKSLYISSKTLPADFVKFSKPITDSFMAIIYQIQVTGYYVMEFYI